MANFGEQKWITEYVKLYAMVKIDESVPLGIKEKSVIWDIS